jgi:type I restriction enzyme S subunit
MNVPVLRFKSDNGQVYPEWQNKAIGDVLSIGSGKDYKHLSSGQVPVYGTGGYMLSVDNYLYDGESVCIGRKGTIDKPTLLNGKFWTVDTLFYTHSFKDCLPKFIYASFQKIDWKNYNEASGVPSLSKSTIEKIDIQIPSVPEQTKIANFLTAVDEKITQLSQKCELLAQYKKGVMQQIFSQKLRFKNDDGHDFPDWKETKLGEFLVEHSEKTTTSNQYRILSSTTKGLFNQDEYFTRDIASKDNSGYKILRKNQLVFSPQNLWLGNINVNTSFEIGIVSPSYKIFGFEETLTTADYCKYLLLTPQMLSEYEQCSEQGASVVRRNLDINLFLEISIYLPNLDEQTKIGKFLNAIDYKFTNTQNQLAAAKQYKQGLLQQMFV